MNEIARNNPKDELSDRSLNNQEGSHVSNKIKKKEKPKIKPRKGAN